jgi:hypothetical protein
MKHHQAGLYRYLFITVAALTLAVRGVSAEDLSGSGATPTTVFDSDFSKGTFDHLGWESHMKSDNWQIKDYKDSKPELKNSPGASAVYGKTDKTDLMIRKFTAVQSPQDLTLTFDGGWGWGQKDQGSDTIGIMLLNDEGTGYLFEVHRIKAKWAVQWHVVNKYELAKEANPQAQWSPGEIDASQTAVIDGGGLQTFTIKRDAKGTFSFSGASWTGATPFEFVDGDHTTNTFSQVALVGSTNFDDLVFNHVKLVVTPQSQ